MYLPELESLRRELRTTWGALIFVFIAVSNSRFRGRIRSQRVVARLAVNSASAHARASLHYCGHAFVRLLAERNRFACIVTGQIAKVSAF